MESPIKNQRFHLFVKVLVKLYWFSKLEKKENFLVLSKPIFIKVVSALWVFQKVKELSDSCVKFGVESGCWSHVPIITEENRVGSSNTAACAKCCQMLTDHLAFH